MLRVHNLTKVFGTTRAVNEVSFDIKEGEIFSLIGPNSSGKTTIIKSIVGLLSAQPETITVDGIDIAKNPEEAKARIGYIPDEPSVWSYMTGEEFLHFTQAIFSPKHRVKSSLAQLLSLFGLEGVEKRYFEEYSRGNRQKFSILAATSHKPKLLLIDEPIVGLDPTGAEIAKKLFKDHAKNGGAVLLVTHTLPVAEAISDRIGFLRNGTLVAVGTLAELQNKAGLSSTASLEEIYGVLAQGA